MKLSGILLVLLVFAASLNSFADSSVGCGLGNYVMKDNSIVSATFRMTTNSTFSNQLFGITSGTSGCAQHSIVKAKMAPVYYAEANIDHLKVEMALGEGEYLSAFADTLGCDAATKNAFIQETQSNYENIFDNENVTAHKMLDNVKHVINQNQSIRGKCQYAVI